MAGVNIIIIIFRLFQIRLKQTIELNKNLDNISEMEIQFCG